MKKVRVFTVIVLLLAFLGQLWPSGRSTALAEEVKTKEALLVDNDLLRIAYQVKETTKHRIWELVLERKEQDAQEKKQLTIKITAPDGGEITYPPPEQMQWADDGWLTERSSGSEMKQLVRLTQLLERHSLKLEVRLLAGAASVSYEARFLLSADPNTGAETAEEESAADNTLDSTEESTSDRATESSEQSEQEATVSPDTAASLAAESSSGSANSAKTVPADLLGPPAKEALTDFPQNSGNQASIQATNAIYENKIPDYQTDDSGLFPRHYWQPEKQAHVRNHQGGHAAVEGWDGVSSWDVTSDTHENSYIQHGPDDETTNIALRKYAQETEISDRFTVKLNVRGNTTYKPGIDVVFLLDSSASMLIDDQGASLKKNAAAAFRKIIQELQAANEEGTGNLRIGMHYFSDYVVDDVAFPISDQEADWDVMVNAYEQSLPDGHTFTQRGLQQAKDLFDAAADPAEPRQQLLFILTDGAPNRSWNPRSFQEDSEMYFDPYYFSDFNMSMDGEYFTGTNFNSGNSTKLKAAVDGVLNSHLTTTNSTAKDLKNAGIEIHTLAIGIKGDDTGSGVEHTTEELKRGLYKLASKKADATGDEAKDYFFHDAADTTNLVEDLKEWYLTIIRSVDNGRVTDPLAEMWELVSDPELTPTLTQVSNGAEIIPPEEMAVLDSSDPRCLTVTNINLSGGQELELTYTLQLKETEAFVSGRWYPLNQRTTLEPTPERTVDILDFGVPSARVVTEDFVIPVQKIWQDQLHETADYWQLRPPNLTVRLEVFEAGSWQPLQELTLKETAAWQDSFAAVRSGAAYRYRVVKVDRVYGYRLAASQPETFTSETLPDTGVRLTNQLLQTDFRFTKLKGGSRQPFLQERPEFTVTRKADGKEAAASAQPDDTGVVTIPDLAVGSYRVTESRVPVGYQQMPDFEIEVTETSDGTELVAKATGLAQDGSITNELADFTLTVSKQDERGRPLTGAGFLLEGPAGYRQERTEGSQFVFDKLRPGRYRLQETKTPPGYLGLIEAVTIVIDEDGQVTIDEHPDVTGSGGLAAEKNAIRVTVKNTVKAVLPATGRPGTVRLVKAAGGLILAGGLLWGLGAYWGQRRRSL